MYAWKSIVVLGLVSLISAFVSSRAEVRVRIDKTAMTLTVYDDAHELKPPFVPLAEFPMACGQGYGQKYKSGDMCTPEGNFTITQILDASTWGHDFGDGKGYIRNAYGPMFFRLSAGRGIGIHGTHDPASMGHRASEGCIRLRNEDLLEFAKLVGKGTKVEITPDKVTVDEPEVLLLDVKPYAVKTIEYMWTDCFEQKH